MRNQSIGVFDSGLGGLTIWKELTQCLPLEHSIYLADSKHAPYGQKTKENIVELSIKNTELLLARGCKLIVVACNTATTNAIDHLRSHYSVPFIGIEPAIKPAALKTKTNAVGILATKGTLSSALFHETSSKFAADVKVIEQIGEGLVPLIESGQIESQDMTDLLEQYLEPMRREAIDYLVLGCSHYPLLIPQIREIMGPDVHIIDSGQAVAKQTAAILEKNDLLTNRDVLEPPHELYTNLNLDLLAQFAKQQKLEHVKCSFLDF